MTIEELIKKLEQARKIACPGFERSARIVFNHFPHEIKEVRYSGSEGATLIIEENSSYGDVIK